MPTLTRQPQFNLAVANFGYLHSDGTCFWITQIVDPHNPGESNRRIAVVWQAGDTGRSNPPRVLDAHGNVVATVGQLVQGGHTVDTAYKYGFFHDVNHCLLGQTDPMIAGN